MGNEFRHMGLAVAAAALLGMHGSYVEPEIYARHFRKSDKRIAQGVPTKKRAKVKAARKANLKRNRSMTTTPNPTGRASVEQADFDDAADVLSDMGMDWGACGDIREGRVAHPLVAAFARRRQQAHAAGVAESSTLRPIESAPRDGTELLAWREHAGFFQAGWVVDFDDDEIVFAGWWDPVADQEVSPTHWLPLPALSPGETA